MSLIHTGLQKTGQDIWHYYTNTMQHKICHTYFMGIQNWKYRLRLVYQKSLDIDNEGKLLKSTQSPRMSLIHTG